MTYEWTALKCKYLFLKAAPNTLLIKFFGYLVIKWLSLYHFQLTYTVRSSENWTKRSTQSSNTSLDNMYYIQYNLHVPAGAVNDLYNSRIHSKPGEWVTEYYLKILFRNCWFSIVHLTAAVWLPHCQFYHCVISYTELP
jgi:hypothetical protein